MYRNEILSILLIFRDPTSQARKSLGNRRKIYPNKGIKIPTISYGISNDNYDLWEHLNTGHRNWDLNQNQQQQYLNLNAGRSTPPPPIQHLRNENDNNCEQLGEGDGKNVQNFVKVENPEAVIVVV